MARDGRRQQNCWDAKRCGYEPGGRRTSELGVCPAATESRLDGLHGGFMAGRACWAVPGTYCKGCVNGDFDAKLDVCLDCDFYQAVEREEGTDFLPALTILRRLA